MFFLCIDINFCSPWPVTDFSLHYICPFYIQSSSHYLTSSSPALLALTYGYHIYQSSDLPHHLKYNPVYQMSRVGVPIIAALKGHVITGGFELALACDILIGDTTTTFRDTHVKFGLAPCWGLSQKLTRRVGPGRAKIVSFTAGPIRADKAHEWGLLDEIVDSSQSKDAVLDRAIELADAISTNNSLMVRRYKRAIEEGTGMEYRRGLQRERELGLAHYLEIVGDGSTFEDAKEYVKGSNRPRMTSKL